MKKMSAVIIVLLLIGMTACNNSAKPKQSKEDVPQNDSILIQKTYYPSGGLWKVKRAKKVTIDGETKYVVDGENLTYYKTPQNTLASKAIYKDAKRNGLYQKFYTDGQLYYEVNYKDGKINGIKKTYNKAGNLMAETPYKEGNLGIGTVEYGAQGVKLDPMELKVWFKKNGNLVTIYAKVLNNGKITKRATFFNGYLIEGKYYHKKLQELEVKDGIASITLTNPPSYIVISAKVKSTYNNYSLLSEGINVGE